MRIALLLLVLLAAGCGREAPAPEPRPGPPDPLGPDTLAPLPAATRTDTLWIEGMAHGVLLQRYDPEPGFPLPFWTYLPPRWAAETVSSGEGDAVRFSPPGALARDVLLSVFIHPAGTTRDRAVRRMEQAALREVDARGGGDVVSEPPSQGWELVRLVYTSDVLAGEVLLTEHAGRFIEISSHYPVEAGDGMAPRIQLILDEWRWRDTGRGLG
jgi:hypothetical protein